MRRPEFLPLLLTFNGGFVDAAGFLALQGLLSAHITGNFVTVPAALVLGTSGVLAKALALPVFCVVVVVARLIGNTLRGHDLPVLRILLALELLLLAIAATLAIGFGPFATGDDWAALAAGMALVSAMALQNTVSRVHLPTLPPTTIMTGTTTQAMLDLADLLPGAARESEPAVRPRLQRAAITIVAFAAGCALAALLYETVRTWCFLVSPALACLSLWCSPPGSEKIAEAR